MTDDLNALRHIEGFPIGEDEDILALSDPPYYTAYPNPHIGEFIEKWGKPYSEATDDYHREPYVADVSEGKNDPIYNAHSYHTKVPYRAIVPFIEHYTLPGDVVFDGFCGTGMTGVAAQMVGRRAVLCDLSPAATFIAYNYNAQVDVSALEREAKRVLTEVEAECGWMYETRHVDGRVGRINYTVWSDVFVCPYCDKEVVYWHAAVRLGLGELLERFSCPGCHASLSKDELGRAVETTEDMTNGGQAERNKQVPVLINYSLGGSRWEKQPDEHDLAVLLKLENTHIPYWYPSSPMLFKGSGWGDSWRAGYHAGISRVDHFYFKRSLWVLAAVGERIRTSRMRRHLATLQTCILNRNGYKGNRFIVNKRNPRGRINGPLSGTLYIPSLIVEQNAVELISYKLPDIVGMFGLRHKSGNAMITTQSVTDLACAPESSFDYIFTDPPFGDNLMYSELNFLWEAWLGVFTRNKEEAIINKAQGKTITEYRSLMTGAFREMYRVLKPGRWITVVFHNSRASVWNAIQESLAHAGFLVAQVTVLDKQHGTVKQLTAPGTVENDLVINAYKPRAGFSQRFISTAGQGLEADFVGQHLKQLPLAANIERSKEMLYSKYLAYYVQHGYQVAYNGDQFYRALAQWGFVERDGYWFADEKQANDYEKRKAANLGKTKAGQAVLFISDEKSARQWLWHFLETPKSYGEIYTAFVKALQTAEDQLPEPRVMLEEGFIQANGEWRRPDAVSQAELERRRQARLLGQFEAYLASARAGQRLNEVRKEAVVAGFAEAYRGARWEDILAVGRKLPKRLIEDDPDIFDFIDIAESKAEA